VASLAALHPWGEIGEKVRIVGMGGAIALLAAFSFGADFQQRTLLLLLSQPMERSRLWSEKFLVLAIAAGVVIVVDCRTWLWLEPFGFWDLFFLGTIMLATVTSSGFWISRTSSVPKGIAGGIVSQLIVFCAVLFALRQVCIHFPVQAAIVLGEHKPQIFAGVVLYAVSFLWFGRSFWKGRLMGFALAFAGIVLILCVASGLAKLARDTGSISGEGFLTLFVVATVCSASFWTLTARSTIGGLAFCVASQLLLAMLLIFGVERISSFELGRQVDAFAAAAAVSLGGLVYSATFLFLGWRKFARLEVRDALCAEGVEVSTPAGQVKWRPGWLVCRPKGNVFNLVRNEIQLQKPVFLVAAMFLVCWVGALALCRAWPERGYRDLLEILLCFYVPLALILAGCVSLGEEKTLGVTGCQLALPVPVRRLWLVKLAIANLTGLAFGLVLPILAVLLAVAADPTGRQRMGQFGTGWLLSLPLGWLTILVSFWASTLVANTLRAVLLTIVAIAFGGGCAALGTWGTTAFCGVQTELLTSVMTHLQLSPISIVNFAPAVTWAGGFIAATWLIGFLLAQSLAHFRRSLERTNLLVQALVLGFTILSFRFWAGDVDSSAYGLYRSQPIMELDNAFQVLASKEFPATDGKVGIVTLAQLDAAAPLSPATKTWLKNSVISYRAGVGADGVGRFFHVPQHTGGTLTFGPNGESSFGRLYQVTIHFPGGGTYDFGCLVPLRQK
jgi:hypothetical protein